MTGSAPKAPQACIVSYPKTGRTWLRVLMGRYLCRRHGLDDRNLTRTEAITLAAGLPRTSFMHGQSGFDQRIHYRELKPDRSWFRNRPVVLLARGIHDTMVSAYLWTTKRLQMFDGSISAFIRDEYFGAPKFLTYYRHWHEARSVPSAFLFLRYEEMHRDPPGALSKVLTFLGASDLDTSLIRDAVEFGSLDNLRKVELEGKHRLIFKEAAPPGDAESMKVRRGEVGRYAEYLSAEDISYLDKLNEAEGCPFTRLN